MGRKIPGKKHRGVKDPYKQQEVRLSKIKDKINRVPKSVDSQEIPRRLQNIARFQCNVDKDKTSDKVKKEKRKQGQQIDGAKSMGQMKEKKGMTRPANSRPPLKQHPQESDERFLKRVDRMTKEALKEAAFEHKFQVDVIRDEHGKVTCVNRREMTDPLLSEKEKLVFIEREKRKKQARKERDFRRRHKHKKKDDDDDEFSYYKDEFKFGEVVHEPPSLDTEKLTKRVNDGITKPKTFLFMEKLRKSGDSETPTNGNNSKLENQAPSLARKRILEEERLRVVKAYRNLKASKHHNPSRSYD